MDPKFVGITALVDAVIAIVAWVVLYMRSAKEGSASNKVHWLASYLLATFVFLLLISVTILQLGMNPVMLMVSDLFLWLSLILFIKLMYSDTQGSNINVMITLFCVFALSRTLWQLAGINGVDTKAVLGDALNYIMSQMDAWLMYVVWVPSAISMIMVALRSDSSVVRARSLMFAIGLLLITFTWAFRLLASAAVDQQLGYTLVLGASVVGFALLLGGVLYRGSSSMKTA